MYIVETDFDSINDYFQLGLCGVPVDDSLPDCFELPYPPPHEPEQSPSSPTLLCILVSACVVSHKCHVLSRMRHVSESQDSYWFESSK